MSEQFSPKPTISADTLQRILDFRDERNWKQFHNPKDLAISLSLEAAELLECFQWSGEDTEVAGKTAAMKEELSDVVIYALLLADRLGLDHDAAVREKIQIKSFCNFRIFFAFSCLNASQTAFALVYSPRSNSQRDSFRSFFNIAYPGAKKWITISKPSTTPCALSRMH